MSQLLQVLLTGALVTGCALYSAWRLMTPAARRRTLTALAHLPGIGRAAWLARLRARIAEQPLSICGGCARDLKPGADARNRTAGVPRR